MKAGKLLLIILGLVVLVIAGLAAFILSRDPNAYKAEIQTLVADNTGRELRLEGDLGWQLFPRLGLTVEKVALSEEGGFDKGTLAEVGQAQVGLALMPLLSGQVEVDSLSLAQVRLTLRPGRDRPAEPEADKAPAGAPDLSGLQQLSLGAISLTDIQVTLLDDMGVTTSQLALQELTLDGFEPGGSSLLHARLEAGDQARQLAAVLDARFETDAALTRVSLPSLAVTATLTPANGKAMTAELQSQGRLDLQAGRFELGQWQLASKGARLSGKLLAEQLFDSPVASGSLSLAPLDLAQLMMDLGQPLPPRQDDTSLTELSLDADWTFAEQRLTVGSLKGKLDDTSLDGSADVKLGGAVPELALTLKLDRLDADRYLPPKAEPQAESKQDEQVQIEPDLSVLKGFVARLELGMDWLKINNLKLENIQMKAANNRGQLSLYPLTAKAYQGDIRLELQLDGRKQPARLQIRPSVQGVQAEPLLKDLSAEGKSLLAGATRLDGELSAQGLLPDSIMASLNGKADFAFTDGAINGINIAHELRKAGALLKGQPVPEEASRKTDFAELSGSATISDGLVHNPDLKLLSPLLRVSGAGDVNLARQELDYGLTTKLVGTLKGQDGKALEELKGVAIPLRITGGFNDPKVKLDMDALLEGKAKAKLEEEKDKLKDKLGEKLGELFKKK
ncbi:AsmA family protein [Gallaecimonas sp. GXIMD4217]|uniref:AsmA family protein n=1 Tax=Gallaecimonas sp. GXIMD4217 TaxID=3131927 RepID=UPI00311AF0A5